jgi:hypothetical protein
VENLLLVIKITESSRVNFSSVRMKRNREDAKDPEGINTDIQEPFSRTFRFGILRSKPYQLTQKKLHLKIQLKNDDGANYQDIAKSWISEKLELYGNDPTKAAKKYHGVIWWSRITEVYNRANKIDISHGDLLDLEFSVKSKSRTLENKRFQVEEFRVQYLAYKYKWKDELGIQRDDFWMVNYADTIPMDFSDAPINFWCYVEDEKIVFKVHPLLLIPGAEIHDRVSASIKRLIEVHTAALSIESVSKDVRAKLVTRIRAAFKMPSNTHHTKAIATIKEKFRDGFPRGHMAVSYLPRRINCDTLTTQWEILPPLRKFLIRWNERLDECRMKDTNILRFVLSPKKLPKDVIGIIAYFLFDTPVEE